MSDGEALRRVYDWAKFADRETVCIKTRRGLELEGSNTHRVMLPDGSWRQLADLRTGDRIKIGGGTNLWSEEYVPIKWKVEERLTLQRVAALVGTTFTTVQRHLRGIPTRFDDKLALLIPQYRTDCASKTVMHNKRKPIRVPSVVNEALGSFLGYLIGDGHISNRKRTIGLTTGDEAQADHFAQLTADLFGLCPVKKWDQTKWRVRFSSRGLEDFLTHLGLKTGFCAREKTVPDAILQSPKPVVAAFLRACMTAMVTPGKRG